MSHIIASNGMVDSEGQEKLHEHIQDMALETPEERKISQKSREASSQIGSYERITQNAPQGFMSAPIAVDEYEIDETGNMLIDIRELPDGPPGSF